MTRKTKYSLHATMYLVQLVDQDEGYPISLGSIVYEGHNPLDFRQRVQWVVEKALGRSGDAVTTLIKLGHTDKELDEAILWSRMLREALVWLKSPKSLNSFKDAKMPTRILYPGLVGLDCSDKYVFCVKKTTKFLPHIVREDGSVY